MYVNEWKGGVTVIKVLVCGSYQGAFQRKLCQRLKKEKQEVYVLSADPVTEKKSAAVFQDYRFSFESESVMNIMKSVSPEAVIFCGALDMGYVWEGKAAESVAYVAGIMNLMACAVEVNVKKFLYISSLDIFSGNAEKIVDETTVPLPCDQREKSVFQGERICQASLAGEEYMKISVIRMSQVYGICEKKAQKSVCTAIAAAVCGGKKVETDSGELWHLLYLDDAVDAVYKVLTGKQKEPQKIYHIVPGASVEPESVKAYFESLLEGEKTVSLRDKEKECRFVSTTQEELEFSEKYTLEEGLQIYFSQYLKLPLKKQEQDKEETKERKKLFRPILETIAAFVCVQLFVTATRGAAFHDVVDVYLIYSMVIAAVLGAVPSVFAIILSVLGKWYVLFLTFHTLSVFTDYNNYLWMLQLFSLVVLTGCLKDWYAGLLGERKRENNYLKNEIESLKSINDSNVEVKEVFEERLVNYKDSYAKVYEIISQLDGLEAKSILFKAAGVVAEIMESKDVAVYIYDGKSGYCRLMASTSRLARQKGKSFRLDGYEEVYDKVSNRSVFMNRKFEENLPMFAVGTFHGEELEAVIMVWSIDLINLNLHKSNLLSMVAKLMERSTTRALKYMDSVKHYTYISGTKVMGAEAFGKMLDIYCEGETEGVLEYTLLEVIAYEEEMGPLYVVLDERTRDTDYLGVDAEGNIYILLTNSNEEESVGVMKRWETDGIQTLIVTKKQGNKAEEVFPAINFFRNDNGKEHLA